MDKTAGTRGDGYSGASLASSPFGAASDRSNRRWREQPIPRDGLVSAPRWPVGAGGRNQASAALPEAATPWWGL